MSAEVLETLPEALRAETAERLGAWREACARAGVELPRVDEVAAHVLAASEFVAESLVREPGLPAAMAERLGRAQAPGELRGRLEAALEGVAGEDELGLRLRRVRRAEMVRIAWRDLGGLAELSETLEDLTELADACVDAALARLYAWEVARFGTPRDERGEAQRLVVLGMGKLGGRELNYSSDIDLIFAFPERGETDGRRGLANEEFFLRLGQRLIKALDAPTAEGFVFRVDMRLRPFGDSGPLVGSFAAFENYYQTQGREWERYAFIKARAIAGDIAAGERLLAGLRPFVYRRYLDYGAFESLREMKAMIAREVERKGLQRNVKLGPGGIREIEFIGQAFQLSYGGREPALRERSILKVLDELGARARLPDYAVEGLKAAYAFLRRTENRLQAWRDQQTHDLPDEPRAKLRLAFAMSHADWPAFRSALLGHCQFVAAQFEQVFAAPQAEIAAEGQGGELGAVWRHTLSEDAAHAALAAHGYREPARALAALGRLRASFAYRTMRSQGEARLDKLMPLLLGAVGGFDAPERTLERVVRLLEAILRRSVYLALLVESPLALSQLVQLCAASEWISEHLARYPMLLDELLAPSSLYAPLDRAGLAAELDRMLARAPADDAEGVLDALRHFKQINVLRVAAADVTGALPLMIVSDHLSEIAEVLVERCVLLAWRDLGARHGVPHCCDERGAREAAFAVIGYGKLGGIELGYGSDLDLVFLHDSCGDEQETDGAKPLDNASFFARLAQRVIHMLTTATAAGVLYEVDTRLRPSGRSGLLVASLDAFAEYQRSSAWTWEHQALARARAIVGPPSIVERFGAIRLEALSRPREREALRAEVRAMRERMRSELGSREAGRFDIKQDRGGIADIEFMVQYLVLAHTRDEPILARFTDNVRQLAALEATGLLSSWTAGLLRDTYRALRRRVHLAKLQDQPAVVDEGELRAQRAEVARLWCEIMER